MAQENENRMHAYLMVGYVAGVFSVLGSEGIDLSSIVRDGPGQFSFNLIEGLAPTEFLLTPSNGLSQAMVPSLGLGWQDPTDSTFRRFTLLTLEASGTPQDEQAGLIWWRVKSPTGETTPLPP